MKADSVHSAEAKGLALLKQMVSAVLVQGKIHFLRRLNKSGLWNLSSMDSIIPICLVAVRS